MHNSPMTETAVSPETRLLSAQIRMGDPKTIKRIVSVLKKKKGDIPATAQELGVSVRAIHLWRSVSPEFAAAFDEESRGRGRPPLPKKTKAKAKVRPTKAK